MRNICQVRPYLPQCSGEINLPQRASSGPVRHVAPGVKFLKRVPLTSKITRSIHPAALAWNAARVKTIAGLAERDTMKRRIRWVMSLWAASMIAGCASGPVVQNTAFNRREPTRVRSLLIVVDDTLFREASDAATGARFARTLGSTLKDRAGSIPVTLLQIDFPSDARALPRTIMSSHATQIMVVKATRVTTRSRGADSAIWQLALSDVSASVVPDATDPSKSATRVVMRTFYRDQVEANVDDTLGLLISGQNSFARELGTAIADKLHADHVLTPDDSSAPVEQSQAPALGNTVTTPAATHRPMQPTSTLDE
jgi:hypothetical protein